MTRQRNNRRTAIAGPALIIVCVLHTAVGVLASAPALGEALASGWFGAMTSNLEVALWFLMTGFFGMVTGLAMTALEHAGRLPWSVSIALLMIALIGVSAAPVSGFLLVLVAAVIAVVQSARQSRQRPSADPGRGERPVEAVNPSASEGAVPEHSSRSGKSTA
ncbi:DUF6463 family protein [Agromyces ramosus]|uniref:Uncharacterized protein n=1 Tax=Agromyces ramosus TaxID=33879 RepID=A0ABU0R514_9MICO|nr:DUF6463 family protein [Agromyces ramosus]MDQ0893179.1 hypothetical protein [Agromyces ramosus]